MGPNEAAFRQMVKAVETLGIEGMKTAVILVVAEIQRRTPRDTHFAASSLRVQVGSPFPGFPQSRDGFPHTPPIPSDVVLGATNNFKLGDDIVLNALAGYFGILAGGLRRALNGRLIGSRQAPTPFINPAIDTARTVFAQQRFAA